MHFQRSLVFTIFATRLYSLRGVFFFAPLNDSVFILCKCKWPHETSELNALKKRFTKQDWIGFGMCVEHWPFYSWFVACHSHWLTQAASFFLLLESTSFQRTVLFCFSKTSVQFQYRFENRVRFFLVLAEIKCVFMISILIRFFLVSVVCWRWLSVRAHISFRSALLLAPINVIAQ